MIVLASGSATRAAMLAAAGVTFEVQIAAVDEEALKTALRQDGADAGQTAEALAEMKARRVSQRCPGRLVLGADQMLECDGEWFDKPRDQVDARDHLRRLRGRTHRLVSAAVVFRDGQRAWSHIQTASLTMRDFSDAFLNDYMNRTGDAILASVGAYQLESLGAQLFARVEGDHFTVLGLPLLAVLDFLRENGELQA